MSIRGRFVVTNSDDGVGDNVVELVGSIYLNGVQVLLGDAGTDDHKGISQE